MAQILIIYASDYGSIVKMAYTAAQGAGAIAGLCGAA